MENEENEKMFTIKQAASMFNVTERTIRQWIYDGKLEAYKYGYKITRISKKQLDAFSEKFKYQVK